MRAGALDRRVLIEQATAGAPSASGEVPLTWATLADVWASKEELSGRELFQAQQVAAKVDTRFRVRYSSDIAAVTPSEMYRLVCEGRTYDITAVLELGRREGLEILAWERAES